VLGIVKYPHPTLRHASKPVLRVDAELRRWIDEMFALMDTHNGIGLAANQVALPYRILVLHLREPDQGEGQRFAFLNPVITKRSGSAEAEEGCLSFPGIYAPVRRPERISMSAYNLAGDEVQCDLDGLFARAVQHEVDHLDGVVFIDRLSETARLSVRDALASLERQFAADQARGLVPSDAQVARHLAELEKART